MRAIRGIAEAAPAPATLSGANVIGLQFHGLCDLSFAACYSPISQPWVAGQTGRRFGLQLAVRTVQLNESGSGSPKKYRLEQV
jgi:hypothetical protein